MGSRTVLFTCGTVYFTVIDSRKRQRIPRSSMGPSSRNVTIMSLLDSTASPEREEDTAQNQQNVPTGSVRNAMSRFQTGVNVSNEPIVIEDDDDDVGAVDMSASQNVASPQNQRILSATDTLRTAVLPPSTTPVTSSQIPPANKPILAKRSPQLPLIVPKPVNSMSPSPVLYGNQASNNSGFVGEHIKKFQLSFQLANSPQTTAMPTAAASVQQNRSKTSINSIINIDDEPEQPLVKEPTKETTSTPTPAPKRKRAAPKKKKTDDESTSKRKKTDPDGKEKPESKKSGKGGKKKTPEVSTSTPVAPVKIAIHPGITTERSNLSVSDITLEPPSVIGLSKEEETKKEKDKEKDSKSDKDVKEREKEHEKEKLLPPPIIALSIPLIDPKNPKPGQSEVVVNVLRLAEEKYGWTAIHPNAKSAIDIMEDMIDDDDDDDDDDDEVIVDDEKSGSVAPAPAPSKKKKEGEELTEEQLVRQHQTRMNRKVGKYDYQDPFIDDEELQMEEEITTTKEGYFVYWGPLVDDRNMTTGSSGKKSSAKGKK
ncbi:hypothetical protein G9P44_001168 [Scheffersomyces stipitis]|nr:hypothetical protein G9P44_001168 [Scheffersomyces stipitis]